MPSSHSSATAKASGIEWDILTNSIRNGPISTSCPGATGSRGMFFSLCSSSFERTISTVNGPP